MDKQLSSKVESRIIRASFKYPNASRYELQHGVNSKASILYREKINKYKLYEKSQMSGKKLTIAEEAVFFHTGEEDIREQRKYNSLCNNILIPVKELKDLDYIGRITLKAIIFKNLPKLKKKIKLGCYTTEGELLNGS